MQRDKATRLLWDGGTVFTSMVVAFFMIRSVLATGQVQQAPSQAGQFRGRVVSASGAVVVGGPSTNPGHPVVGATVHR